MNPTPFSSNLVGRPNRSLRVACVLSLIVPVTASFAQTWVGGGPDNNFSNPLNWQGGVAPVNNGTAAVTFSGTGSPVNVTIDANYSVQSLTASGSSILGLFGSQALTVTNNIKISAPTVLSSTVQLVLGGSGVTFDTDPSKEFDVVGQVSGAGLTKTGSGTVVLMPYTQANTYSGGTTITGGTLTVRVDSDLGNASGAVTFGGAGGSLGINVAAGGQAGLPPGANGLFSRNVGFNAGATGVIVAATDANWAGVLSGSGNFTKGGNAVLTLSNTNTLTGTTTVSAGTLRIDGALPNSPIIVGFGGSLGGSGSIGKTVNVLPGGAINGFTGTFGDLVSMGASTRFTASGTTVFPNGLSLAATSELNFHLGPTADKFVITGGVLSGPTTGKIVLNLSASAGYTAGVYTLFDFSTGATTSSFDVTDFALGQILAGSTSANYELKIVSNTLQLTSTALVPTAVPEPSTWAMWAGLSALGFAFARRRFAAR